MWLQERAVIHAQPAMTALAFTFVAAVRPPRFTGLSGFFSFLKVGFCRSGTYNNTAGDIF